MIEFFDILKTIKNKKLHIEGVVDRHVGLYDDTDVERLMNYLSELDESEIEIKELHLNKLKMHSDFVIDVVLTTSAYEKVYDRFQDIIELYDFKNINVTPMDKWNIGRFIDYIEDSERPRIPYHVSDEDYEVLTNVISWDLPNMLTDRTRAAQWRPYADDTIRIRDWVDNHRLH